MKRVRAVDRVILHCDMNNFFASVELLNRPELRDKPVAVAGDPQTRHGIVLAKNELAKKCGVKTADPLWRAKQLCPEIVFISPHMDRYICYSGLAKKIYADYTDLVESFGLDECWLDVTGSNRLFGEGKALGDTLRSRMKRELGLSISVGVSWNKVFAKLGSDYKKPDATTEFTRLNYRQKIWPLAASELLFVGPATSKKLEKYGIHTIGDIVTTNADTLYSWLGKSGRLLWTYANGLDASPVLRIGEKPEVKSIGNSTTTVADIMTDAEAKITLYSLCDSVAERLRRAGLKSSCVQLWIRYSDLSSCERQEELELPISNSFALFEAAFAIYRKNRVSGRPVRSLGVRACRLSRDGNMQISIFPEAVKNERQDKLENAVDGIRNKFGHSSLKRALLLESNGYIKQAPA